MRSKEARMKQTMWIGMVALAVSAAPLFAQDKPASGKMGSDQHFVMEAAHIGMAEVAIGKVAADKASSADVKKFAQRMVDDHGKANDELKTLAQNKQITLPTSLDAAHQTTLDKLSKMSGDAFDRTYMQEMVNGHKKAVSMFQMESKSGADADVKAWAAKTLPTLEEHLKVAQELSKKPVGTTGKK
jgi:putative membrane protein